MDEKKFAVIGAIISSTAEILFSEKGKKFICGTYSDGTARSITDAVKGEIISPKQKDKRNNIKKIKSKNKNKKSKKNKKKNKSDIYWL